jgi:6-phosphogluconolactonase
VVLHPGGKFLYATNETGEFKGQKSGGISAFAIPKDGGPLTLLNTQPSMGGAPCHLSIDRTGKYLLVANYTGGNVAVLPILPDGKLGPATSTQQHSGSSINKQRQQAAYAHSINLDSANRFAFVADLGIDKVMIYKFDAKNGALTPNEPAFATVPAGGGPRHLSFHPNGRFVYVNNELTSSVNAFRYDARAGALTLLQTLSTLPENYVNENNTTAEVLVHPSGKFLYVSNRVHDSIASFAIDGRSGKLRILGHTPTQGKIPRNFNIDPTGNFLVVANQDSDSLVVFRIDPATGSLTPTGHQIEVPMPVCIKFLPILQ